MADFQRKQIPFLHKGLNWNSPVEKLQDGQVCWAKNVRVLEQGTVSTAHGHTQVFQVAASQYIHSHSRLNVLNEAFDSRLRRTFVVGADDNLYVFQDQNILDGLNPVATPLTPPYTQHAFSGNPLSIVDVQPAGAAVAWKYIGDSKQMVTVGYYPGDQYDSHMARCLTIGLDPPVANWIDPAHGVGGGTATDLGSTGSTGSITTIDSYPTSTLRGDYQWMFAFRRVQTGARSNPSAATRFTVTHPAYTVPYYQFSDPNAKGQVVMRLPVPPIDPLTGQPDTHVLVDIYRFGGSIFRWALVGSAPGSTATHTSLFYDNVPDESLLAAPSPPQATDSSTGLTRFNLFRPFVTQDIARAGSATLQELTGPTLIDNQKSPGVFILQTADTNLFNPQWLAGSTIYLNEIACTIYQVISPTELEIADDLSGQMTGVPGGQLDFGVGKITWSTNAGTLMAGQPLPHIWGPYGIGQSGSYIFGCGDLNATGTLYWTNGNDPDSTDIVNNIIVTSPSERLMTGAVYDGQPYCWSTERQFQIFPSLTLFGQFTTQEVAGAKGVWLEWSLSVQSNGFADQSVTWRGKDGIYDFSAGGGLQRLTDPLFSFFPHDNWPSIAPEAILPFIGPLSQHPENVGSLDDTQPKYHRLCWFHGLLFYDFVALTGAEVPTFSTLVWDSVNTNGGGWISLDQPFADTNHPVARFVDIGANLARKPDGVPDVDTNAEGNPPIFGPAQRGGNLSVTWGDIIYDYYGLARGFESRFITRAEDLGDSRAQKRWGDYWLDCTPLNEFFVLPLAGFHRCTLTGVIVPTETAVTPDFCDKPPQPGSRAQFILDFQEFFAAEHGASLMSPTMGLDIRWIGADGQYAASLNQWQPSYVLKPEIISFRASDPDDLGQLQAKYFTGLNLEANTFGQTTTLNVLIDGNTAGRLNANHDGQSEHPYAITPTVGYETQLQMNGPQDINGQPVTWQFFKAQWFFEPWPDATTRDSFFSDLGYTGSKFIQGFVLPIETGGQPVTFNVQGDCGQKATMGPVSTPANCKMDLAFSFSPCNNSPSEPFIASQIQIQPNQAARFWYDQARWVFEPEPELVATWQTQPTDHDFATYHHQRDCWICYRGGNGTPTLYITTEFSTEAYVLDPVVLGQYTRCYRVLKPQKALWRSYRVEGCGLFRLYQKDSVIRVKQWGSTAAYIEAHPFGEVSRVSGARI